MTRFLAYASFFFLAFGLVVEAAGPPVLTQSQQSAFRYRAQVEIPVISVPTVVDVPVTFPNGLYNGFVLVGSDQLIPHASLLLTDRRDVEVGLIARDEQNPPVESSRMVDGLRETYADFTYDEVYSDEGLLVPERISIDVRAQESISTNAMSFTFGENSARPKTVRVAIVDEDGGETVILRERVFPGNTISFPLVDVELFRITFSYLDYFRISDIVFHEKSPEQEVRQVLRFNAMPQQKYFLFYESDQAIAVNTGEQPQLRNAKAQLTGRFLGAEDNPEYKQNDSDEDGIVDALDNCALVANSDQIDRDDNGAGDACEDFDLDGVINARDNCPDVPNKDQRDVDQDGRGDVCDADESRLLERYKWLPGAMVGLVTIIVVCLMVRVLRRRDR